jgi:hypothetical protein
VRYVLDNTGAQPRTVGLRFLLDTFIGGNDGVPFLIPGQQAGCETFHVFQTGAEVPDYLLALETNDLRNPGTVARIQLKPGGAIEAPEKVILGAWPSPALNPLIDREEPRPLGALTLWDVPVRSMQTITSLNTLFTRFDPDSAVVMYWPPRELKPGKSRVVGFAYGLGQIAGDEAGGALCVLNDGLAAAGQPFTVQAVVSKPVAGQTLTLELPEGLRFASGEKTLPVPPAPAEASRPQSTVTWSVIGKRQGSYRFTVRSSSGIAQSRTVVVRQDRDIWSH